MKDALARLYPLKDDILGSSNRALELMLGAVGLVLLLVCINVANLLLVRGSERGREFAVRAALGAERGRIVRQMLIESVTLALVGDVAGLVVARIAMAGIVAIGMGTIPRLSSLTLDWTLLAFSIGVSTISAVAFGIVPALSRDGCRRSRDRCHRRGGTGAAHDIDGVSRESARSGRLRDGSTGGVDRRGCCGVCAVASSDVD